MNNANSIQGTPRPTPVLPSERLGSPHVADGAPRVAELAGGSHAVRLPRPRGGTDPSEAIASVNAEYGALMRSARAATTGSAEGPVDIHRILMTVARETRLDQQGSLEQAQTTIETNRRLRDQIYDRVKEIQEELQKLQEEIADLKAEIDGHNFFEKAGEGISSAFGGGKGKDLQKKQASMTIEQGKLKEAEARLEDAKKLIEHGHELMESSINDLKKIVERINASIQLVKDAVNKETSAVGRA